MKISILFIVIFFVVSGITQESIQQFKVDSVSLSNGNNGNNGDNGDNGDELILEDIDIQGVVNQPGVTIFPKRIAPELDEVEMSRSFHEELKGSGLDVISPVEKADKLERVQSIKKAMKKNRKKEPEKVQK